MFLSDFSKSSSLAKSDALGSETRSLLDKINDELEARDKKNKLSKENASMRVREVEMLKKTVAQYAENIKQLETALAEAKKSKADIKPIEAELSRYRLLYNNSASSLEEKLKK